MSSGAHTRTHTLSLTSLLAHGGNQSIFSCRWPCTHCMGAQSQRSDSAECLRLPLSSEGPSVKRARLMGTVEANSPASCGVGLQLSVCSTSWARQTQGGGARVSATLRRPWELQPTKYWLVQPNNGREESLLSSAPPLPPPPPLLLLLM